MIDSITTQRAPATSIASVPGPLPEPAPAPLPAPRSETSTSLGFEHARATDVSLSVVTADGDTVTLSSAVREVQTFAAVQTTSAGEEGSRSASARFEQTTTRSELSLAVEGEIDPEESGDLRKLFRAVGRIVKRFAKGDVAGALRAVGRVAERFGRLESLQGFDLSLSVETRTAAVAAQTTTTAEAPIAGGPAPGGADPGAGSPASTLPDAGGGRALPTAADAGRAGASPIVPDGGARAARSAATDGAAPPSAGTRVPVAATAAGRTEDVGGGAGHAPHGGHRGDLRDLVRGLVELARSVGIEGPRAGRLLSAAIHGAIRDLQSAATGRAEKVRLEHQRELLEDAVATETDDGSSAGGVGTEVAVFTSQRFALGLSIRA